MREHYTAAEIGAALGKSRQAIHRALAGIPPDGTKLVRNNLAAAWALDSLPIQLRSALTKLSQARGGKSIAEVVAKPVTRWEPSLPLARLAPAIIARATKLRDALAWALAARNDLSLSAAEFQTRGLKDYQVAFGHSISARRWRKLLERTVDRDAGAEDWQRLEIYLDDKLEEKTPALQLQPTRAIELQTLCAIAKSIAGKAVLDEEQKQNVWQHAFDAFADLQAGGKSDDQARRLVLAELAPLVPALARSREALKKAFDYKLPRWREAGGLPQGLCDRRSEANKARSAPEIAEEDHKTLLAYSLKFGGGLSQGWREALRQGALSPDLVARFDDSSSSKSYVPHTIRQKLGPEVKALEDLMHGPRCAKLNGPHIDRDPTAICAGDWMQGDDCTLPNFYYEETAQGLRFMRGQLLVLIDVRTFYILGFVLISAAQDRGSSYNAWHIRNLITTVHDVYGLPRCGFYFENGSWRARVLTGNSWNETELGLRRFGVRFVHAKLPRAKTVERLFGMLQNLTEAEPGYVGRDERHDRYERVQRFKSLAESGQIPAGEHFLSRDEWIERIAALVDRINDEPQEGKYCGGLSPREAYERHYHNQGTVRLSDDTRYLLANEIFTQRVGRNGIVINRSRGRGEVFTYKSELTGELWGRDVEVFFNLESPELIGLKHPDTGNVVAVRRSTIVPAMDAPAELLAQANAENSAHMEYRRALYRAVVPKFSEHFAKAPIFRPTLVDAATAEAGRHFRETAEAAKVQERKEKSTRRKAAAAGARIGLPIAGPITEERANAAEELARLLEKAQAPKPSSP